MKQAMLSLSILNNIISTIYSQNYKKKWASNQSDNIFVNWDNSYIY